MLVVSCCPLGLYLCGGFISPVRFSKFMLWFSGSIKYSSCMCFPTYYSSAGDLNKLQLCKLVLMFRFLWISAGPTYSALPVNAKEVSGDVFHCWSIDCGFLLSIYLQSSFWFQIVLAEYFYSLLCLFGVLGTRWSSMHGMGVTTSLWACIHLCHLSK